MTWDLLQVLIGERLEEGLPESYSAEEYNEKCRVAFQHIYDNYASEGLSVYDSVR